jgi:hypothetical protein
LINKNPLECKFNIKVCPLNGKEIKQVDLKLKNNKNRYK